MDEQAVRGGRPLATPKVTRERPPQWNVHEEFQGGSNKADPSTRVPNIIVHKTNGQESSISPSEGAVVFSSSHSSKKLLSGPEANLNPAGIQLQPGDRPDHQTLPAEGPIIPTTVLYHLHITFEGKPLVPSTEGTVPVNEVSSYRHIEKLAEQRVQESHAQYLASKELIFRHGSCKIVSEGGHKAIYALTLPEDWKDVCIAVIKYWTSQSHRTLHLDIFRDYFALQSHGLGKVPFSSTKRDEIDSLMKRSSSRSFYIPRIDLMKVTSTESIRQIIIQDDSLNVGPDEKEDFIKDVQQRARKLLAMCVLARLKMECLKTLMHAGLCDESLPLKEKNRCHPKCNADFRYLLDKQGGFMAPEFNTVGEHKALHSCVVIPVHFHSTQQTVGSNAEDEIGNSNSSAPSLENEDDAEKKKACCGSGAYSKVYRVRIDPDHHRLSQDRDSDFALKEFKDRPSRAGVGFKQEMDILKELCKYPHTHIVTHLASWTQDGKDFMLFPYAQCNLREYMKRTSFDINNKECLLWFLEQLLGLAHALRNLHDFVDTQSTASRSTLVAPSPEVRKSGWHHDIKPENILYYCDIGVRHGTFRMADFGSGKVHTYRSGSVNTRTPNGTLTYEPPEAKYEGATSRPYDVWSLGCVFLELLIWAVFKNDAVEGFANERVARRFPDSQIDEFEDDAFWQMREDGRPFRRDSVDHQIRHLREEASKQEAQPFKEVVELIERMLDPNRRARIIALDVWDTLNRIVNQKKVDLDDTQDSSVQRGVDTKGVPFPRLSVQAPVRDNSELSATGISYEDSRTSPTAYISSSSIPPALANARGTIPGEHRTVSAISMRSPRLGHHRRGSSASENTLSPGPVQFRNPSWSSTGAAHGDTSQDKGNSPTSPSRGN